MPSSAKNSHCTTGTSTACAATQGVEGQQVRDSRPVDEHVEIGPHRRAWLLLLGNDRRDHVAQAEVLRLAWLISSNSRPTRSASGRHDAQVGHQRLGRGPGAIVGLAGQERRKLGDGAGTVRQCRRRSRHCPGDRDRGSALSRRSRGQRCAEVDGGGRCSRRRPSGWRWPGRAGWMRVRGSRGHSFVLALKVADNDDARLVRCGSGRAGRSKFHGLGSFQLRGDVTPLQE